jgi:ribonuclease HI
LAFNPTISERISRWRRTKLSYFKTGLTVTSTELSIFTDASTSSQACIAVGVILILTPTQIQTCTTLSDLALLNFISQEIIYQTYSSKKSTWSEIKTIIDALNRIREKNPTIRWIEIMTDCKSFCDLMTRRKEKLIQENFITKSGKILNNAELYKQVFSIAKHFELSIVKIKGHQTSENRLTIYEKIFAIVDKLSRKKLRLVNNEDISNK